MKTSTSLVEEFQNHFAQPVETLENYQISLKQYSDKDTGNNYTSLPGWAGPNSINAKSRI
jgi:hypothetical protein